MSLELPPESWGDRLRRARLYGKRRYGYSYRELAEHVATVLHITDRAIVALEHKVDAPTYPRQRQIAALYALALGFTPESLGIDDAAHVLRHYDRQHLQDLLDPEGWSPKHRRMVAAHNRSQARQPASARQPPDDQK
jgi:hypothetical protein